VEHDLRTAGRAAGRGTVVREREVVVSDIDLHVGLHAKRWFDVAGHYSRTSTGHAGGRVGGSANEMEAVEEPG